MVTWGPPYGQTDTTETLPSCNFENKLNAKEGGRLKSTYEEFQLDNDLIALSCTGHETDIMRGVIRLVYRWRQCHRFCERHLSSF